MVDFKDILSKCTGFQWDRGNLEKNWLKHQVSRLEIEQVFFNRPLLVAVDDQHSQKEQRFFALGTTDLGRRLFMVFTVRRALIRVISARDMSRRERKVYDDAKEKEDPEV
jgi:uncharacterized DUF497 family protein